MGKFSHQTEPAPPTQIVAFDCDGTLIRHFAAKKTWDGEVIYRAGWEPRAEVVNILKAFRAMPNVKIIVWSYGGAAWAHHVAQACGVLDDADEVVGKDDYAMRVDEGIDPEPDIYFDDNGIGAFGKVWVDVDPDYDNLDSSLSHAFWTTDEYNTQPPCWLCGNRACTTEHAIDNRRVI